MRQLVFSLCFAMAPLTVSAEDLTRDFNAIGEYQAAAPVIFPDFKTDFWQLDMTPSAVRDRMERLGYEIRRDFSDSIKVDDGNIRVVTEKYQREMFGRKEARAVIGSPNGIDEQTLSFFFAPPEGGVQRISGLVRDVIYHYRDGQKRLNFPAVDAAMKEKYGPGSNEGSYVDGNNRYFFRTYCYDKAATLKAEDKTCTLQTLKNGIATVIKLGDNDDVMGFNITYFSAEYDQSLNAAIKDKLAPIAAEYKKRQLEQPDLGL